MIMVRSYTRKDNYIKVQAIGDGRYYMRFSEIYKTTDDVEMVYFTETTIDHEPTSEDFTAMETSDLLKRKEYKKKDVQNYASNDLKAVSINGEDVWFDSEKRTSIVRSIEAERNLGQTTTKLEVNGHIYEMTIVSALTLMDNIDKYSKDCYINTVSHENTIDTLTDLQAVMEYDYTTGYPEKPEFTI